MSLNGIGIDQFNYKLKQRFFNEVMDQPKKKKIKIDLRNIKKLNIDLPSIYPNMQNKQETKFDNRMSQYPYPAIGDKIKLKEVSKRSQSLVDISTSDQNSYDYSKIHKEMVSGNIIIDKNKNKTKSLLKILSSTMTINKNDSDRDNKNLQDIYTLRRKINTDFEKLASIKDQDKSSLKLDIIQNWKKIINLVISRDISLLIETILILGELYIEFNDFTSAKSVFHFAKFLCKELKMPIELSKAYSCLGSAYKYLYNHKKAIKCYKKELEIDWIMGDKISELRAYSNIGLQYFYLSDKIRARYYHDRMIQGRVEKQSQLKKSTMKRLIQESREMFLDELGNIRYTVDSEKTRAKLKHILSIYESSDKALEKMNVSDRYNNINDSFISDTDLSFLSVENADNDDYDVNMAM